MILFGERSLRHALSAHVAHYRAARPHQGKGNIILFPSAQGEPDVSLSIEGRERLVGCSTTITARRHDGFDCTPESEHRNPPHCGPGSVWFKFDTNGSSGVDVTIS
jgi:hypothetical protein